MSVTDDLMDADSKLLDAKRGVDSAKNAGDKAAERAAMADARRANDAGMDANERAKAKLGTGRGAVEDAAFQTRRRNAANEAQLQQTLEQLHRNQYADHTQD